MPWVCCNYIPELNCLGLDLLYHMSQKNALTNLIELASNVTDAYTTALYTADLKQGTLTLRSHLTLSSHLKTDAAFVIGEGILGQAALRK